MLWGKDTLYFTAAGSGFSLESANGFSRHKNNNNMALPSCVTRSCALLSTKKNSAHFPGNLINAFRGRTPSQYYFLCTSHPRSTFYAFWRSHRRRRLRFFCIKSMHPAVLCSFFLKEKSYARMSRLFFPLPFPARAYAAKGPHLCAQFNRGTPDPSCSCSRHATSSQRLFHSPEKRGN